MLGRAGRTLDPEARAEALAARMREANGVLKDLGVAIREARGVAPAIVDEYLNEEIKKGLARYEETIRAAMDAAVAKVNAEFDRLADLLMGRDAQSRREGRADIPALVDQVTGGSGPARVVTDARQLGGDISGTADPRAVRSVDVDARGAVLLEQSVVSIAHGADAGTADAVALLLSGRINGSRDRAQVLYVMDEDGVATLVTELEALMSRAAPMGWLARYQAAKVRRIAAMDEAGAHSPLTAR